jgi:hypothetical protein
MQLLLAMIFIALMQIPAPNALDTLTHQAALLYALLSASFRHKQKNINKKADGFFNPPLFYCFLHLSSLHLIISNPALCTGHTNKGFQRFVFRILLIGFKSFAVYKFAVQNNIA